MLYSYKHWEVWGRSRRRYRLHGLFASDRGWETDSAAYDQTEVR